MDCAEYQKKLRLNYDAAMQGGRQAKAIVPGSEVARLWLQAVTAETIAQCWALNVYQLFDWACRHRISLVDVNQRGRLCRENSWVFRDFVADKPLQLV